MKDGITQLAKMFKERENIMYSGPQIGIVVSPPPAIQVSLSDKIVLGKDNLIISAHVLGDYQRQVELTGNSGDLTIQLKGDPPPAPNDYNIVNLSAPGTLAFTNTLVKGDEVILIPSSDNQTYFLVDKAVRL